MENGSVISISEEGEGLNIYKEINPKGTIHFNVKLWTMFEADDLDMTEEEFEAFMESRSKTFDTFEEAFADIKTRSSWYRLHISNVHPDYKDYIENELKLARINKG